MATETKTKVKTRCHLDTGNSFSLEDTARLRFTSPDGMREKVLAKKGPFLIIGLCVHVERAEDEFYSVVLTDRDHPGWTTEIPMDMVVQEQEVVLLNQPMSRCFGWFLHFLGGK